MSITEEHTDKTENLRDIQDAHEEAITINHRVDWIQTEGPQEDDQVTVNAKHLSAAYEALHKLQKLQPEDPSGVQGQILLEVLPDFENAHLTISDMETEARATIPVSTPSDDPQLRMWSIVLPKSKSFRKFLKQQDDTDLTISTEVGNILQEKCVSVHIEAEGIEYETDVGCPGNYDTMIPHITDSFGARVNLTVDQLKEIERVADCASNDKTRPVLTGLLFEENDDGLSVTATDAYRLHHKLIRNAKIMDWVEPDNKRDAEMMAKADVFASFRIAARKQRPRPSGDDTITLAWREMKDKTQKRYNYNGDGDGRQTYEIPAYIAKLTFDSSDYPMQLRLWSNLNANFPNWRKVVPEPKADDEKDLERTILVDREDVVGAIDKLDPIAQDNGHRIVVYIPNGEGDSADIHLSSASSEGNESVATDIEGYVVGDEIEFAVSGRYLTEYIDNVDADRVQIDVAEDPSKEEGAVATRTGACIGPLVVRPANDGKIPRVNINEDACQPHADEFLVLMPMMLD